MDGDPTRSSWLHASLLPSVLLVESQHADAFEAACNAVDPPSGGSLLRLLDSRRGSRRPIEFLTPTTRMSQQVRVRFCAPTELTLAKDSRSLDNALFQAVASVNPEKRGKVDPMPYPWYLSFRRTLVQATMTWKELADETGSTLALPLVLLIAISASERDPVAHVTEMIDKEPYSGLLPRVIILVADANTAQTELDTTLKLTKAAFGADSVSVLALQTEKTFDESFHEIMTKIVMNTQRRVFSLNEVVSSQKKGLGNTIRSLFGGGSSGAHGARHTATREGKVYPTDSLPYKVRLLADLLFWLRDYEGALTNYSYVRDDYARDEAFLHYASTCEMIALCSFLARGPPPSIEEGARRVELVDRAVESYFRGVTPEMRQASQTTGAQAKRTALGYRLATRACLLSLEIAPKNAVSNYKVVKKALAHEDELCTAIILEQSSLLLVDVSMGRRGMRRRSAFNLLNAGTLYRSLGLDRHAFRCYAAVHDDFVRKGWHAAEHHLEVNLGNLSRNLSDVASLVEFRGLSLERGYEIVGSNQQAALLKELVESIEVLPATSRPLRFLVPKMSGFSALRSEADLEVESAESVAADASWQALEKALVTVAKLRPRRSTKVQAYLSEPLFMELTVSNILNCPVDLFDLSLVVSSDVSPSEPPASLIKVESIAIVAKSSRRVRIGFVPLQECTLKVLAVSWKLSRGAKVPFQQDLATGPIAVEVSTRAPCLRPSAVVADASFGKGGIGEARIELKNIGAAPIEPNSRLLVASDELGALEFSTPGDTSKCQVVDDHGLVVALSGGPAPIASGSSLSLLVKVLATSRPLIRCSIMFDGGRVARFMVRCAEVTNDVPVNFTGRFLATSEGEHLVVFDLDSPRPIRPLGVSAFGTAWSLAPVGNGSFDGVATPETRWSIVTKAIESDREATSFVPLDSSYRSSKFGALDPSQDFRLRCFHASKVSEERAELKKQIERERAELEAKGQLPVSIQDVRRARQRGELPPARSDAVTLLPPGSPDAIRESADLIHVALDFAFADSPDQVRRVYLTRIPCRPNPVILSVLSPTVKELRLRPNQDLIELPLTIRVANRSRGKVVEDVCLHVGLSPSTGLHDRFPRPAYWLGPTKKRWDRILPGQAFDIAVRAVFTSSGVFAIGPFTADYLVTGGADRAQTSLDDERFVAVFRDEIDDETLYKRVEDELME